MVETSLSLLSTSGGIPAPSAPLVPPGLPLGPSHSQRLPPPSPHPGHTAQCVGAQLASPASRPAEGGAVSPHFPRTPPTPGPRLSHCSPSCLDRSSRAPAWLAPCLPSSLCPNSLLRHLPACRLPSTPALSAALSPLLLGSCVSISPAAVTCVLWAHYCHTPKPRQAPK